MTSMRRVKCPMRNGRPQRVRWPLKWEELLTAQMRRLRAIGDKTPAIAVTACARSDDRRSALDCGYAAYLSKAIDGQQLAKTIRAVVPAAVTLT
jgi:hypothetical protein